MNTSGILNRSLLGVHSPGVVNSPITPSDWEQAIGEITNQSKFRNNVKYFTTVEGFTGLAQTSQVWQPTETNQSFFVGQIEVPVYIVYAPFQIDAVSKERIDETLSKTGAGGNCISYMQSLCKTASAQKIRLLALYGMDANEGILEGATEWSWGPDPSGASEITTMNPIFVYQKLVAGVNKVLASVQNTTRSVSILTSLQIRNWLETTLINLKDGVITGGSSLSIAQQLRETFGGENSRTKIEINIGYDSTFSKREGDLDYIFINAPGLSEEELSKAPELNEFFKRTNSLPYNTTIDVGEKLEAMDPVINRIHRGYYQASAMSGVTLRADTALLTKIQFTK